MPGTVRLHRVLRATPERVYRAFLDPDAMVKWLPPNGFTGKVHHLDARVGGTYRMSFTNFTRATATPSAANILELVPHERIRYTDRFDDPENARRNAGDDNAQKGLGRDRGEHRSGRGARRHSPLRRVISVGRSR